ncbi:IDEAL domain-containing protein [Ureibacillus xyleni]|uniref:IDEAL domain-containing protein n=2 Tax=Ureibacillus xyleni TaxID=614648 RepID=A0A285RBN3_9BACL|nr:IDEAL domain-containing protein [Ureibacillus xyleni]
MISMDKYYSYTDFLKAVGHYQHANESERLLNEIYLDLFLNSMQRLQRIDQLKDLIDRALDERNKEAFYAYTTELNQLQETQELEEPQETVN